jgi:hypothetical protein
MKSSLYNKAMNLESPPPGPFHSHHLSFVAVCLAYIAVALVMNLASPSSIDFLDKHLRYYIGHRNIGHIAVFLCGLKLSEISAHAFLMTHGPGRTVKRFLVVAFSAIVLCAALIIGFFPTGIPSQAAIFLWTSHMGLIALLSAFYTAIYWLLRRQVAWTHLPVKVSGKSQFNTRYLFAVMICIAICIPLIRLSIPGTQTSPGFPFFWALVWMAYLGIGILSFVVLQTEAFFSRGSWGIWIAFIAAVLLGPYCFQLFSEQLCRGTPLSFRNNENTYWTAYVLMAGFALGNAVVLIALRLLGFQMKSKSELTSDGTTRTDEPDALLL